LYDRFLLIEPRANGSANAFAELSPAAIGSSQRPARAHQSTAGSWHPNSACKAIAAKTLAEALGTQRYSNMIVSVDWGSYVRYMLQPRRDHVGVGIAAT